MTDSKVTASAILPEIKLKGKILDRPNPESKEVLTNYLDMNIGSDDIEVVNPKKI